MACSLLAVVGLVVAHASNNMINDYFDLEGGVDTDDYVRALYAPHPILSGWVTKRQLGAAILITNAIDLAIMLYLTWAARPARHRASPSPGCSSRCSTSPRRSGSSTIGLGEPGVFIVWGPLMTVGTFFVATGAIPGWVWIASLPYAILVTTVLFGKHIDKIDADTKKGVRTLPVILGERRARAVARALMIAFYPIVARRRRSSAGSGRGSRSSSSGCRGSSRRCGRSACRGRRPRRTATSAGRCGSSARRSSTPGERAGCWCSGCC